MVIINKLSAQNLNIVEMKVMKMKILTIFVIFLSLLSYASFAQKAVCDYNVDILVDGYEFQKEDFKWRMKATKVEGISTNITGTAKIESNGNTIKSYKPWTSEPISKQKTSSEYSPNLKGGEYEITAEISTDCNDTNKDNNKDVKTITIKGENGKNENNTKNDDIKSAEVNEEAKGNQITDIAANVVKSGSEPSQSENASAKEPIKKAEEENNSNVIYLKENDNMKNSESQSAAQTAQVVYTSSSEKSKSIILMTLLVFSVLFNIILIWER